jgi:hypothetical protein
MAEPKTTNPAAVVDDPIKVVEETSEKAKYDTEGRKAPGAADATNGRAWLSEHRVDNKYGVIRGFDGKEFKYDVEGLGEYSIEKNRAKAIEDAEQHFEDSRHLAQHHFETGDATAADGNRA